MNPLKSLKLWVVSKPSLKYFLKKVLYRAQTLLSLLNGYELDERPKILGYHTVGQGKDDLSITPDQFEKQLNWLQKNRFHIITLRQWWDIVCSGHQPAPRTVILTFDDGFKGVSSYAAPILAKRGLAATVFIVTGFIGQQNSYDNFLDTREIPMMDWDDVELIQDLGWDIQSHGHRHYPHYHLSSELRAEELIVSKDILEKRTGQPVEFFCYPYGAFDRSASDAVSNAGYAAAVTCCPGILEDYSLYHLPRLIVDGHQTLNDFTSLFREGYLKVAQFKNSFGSRSTRSREQESVFDALEKFSSSKVTL